MNYTPSLNHTWFRWYLRWDFRPKSWCWKDFWGSWDCILHEWRTQIFRSEGRVLWMELCLPTSNLQYLRMWLYLEIRSLTSQNEVIRVDPNQIWLLGKFGDSLTHRDKCHWTWRRSSTSQEERPGTDPPLMFLRRNCSRQYLHLVFWPPGPGDVAFLLFRPPSLW